MQEKLEDLTEFQWNDQFSEELIHKDGLAIESREETIHESNVKYTGEWAGTMRHGKGTQIWPDGARYDGYFYKD